MKQLVKLKKLINDIESVMFGDKAYLYLDVLSEAKEAYQNLVKESDSLPCVISSLPEYDVEEINEIVQELKDGKQTLFEAIGNIWNKGYMTGSGD